jgi:hypothetical protein
VQDLVESDVKSDGRDSLCEDQRFESEGDDVEVEERDMWADHLVQRWMESLSPRSKRPQYKLQRKLLILIWGEVTMARANHVLDKS